MARFEVPGGPSAKGEGECAGGKENGSVNGQANGSVVASGRSGKEGARSRRA